MPTNPNVFCEEPTYSRDVCQCMRDVNYLQSRGAGTPQYDRTWNINVSSPIGLHVYGDEVYVTNAGDDTIRVYDLNGTYQRGWGSTGSGDGEFDSPYGVYVYNNEVYVADRNNRRIQVFSLTGVYNRQWSVGALPNTGITPLALHIFTDEVYVCGSAVGASGDGIKVYSLAGVLNRSWGFLLNVFSGIAEYNNEIYVTDLGSVTAMEVVVFDTAGNQQRTFGSYPDEYLMTKGIDVVRGRLYVVDTNRERIRVTTKVGQQMTVFGTPGSGNGQVNAPWGISVYENEIYVADTGNNRIQVFRCPQTNFSYYRETSSGSLGAPDGGATIPDLEALIPANNDADWIPNHLSDIRIAIAAARFFFMRPSTNLIYTLVTLLEDAMGDYSDYGGFPPTPAGWTTNLNPGAPPLDIDIGELRESLNILLANESA